MAGNDLTVRVSGMKELRGALRELSDGKAYGKELQKANKRAATIVADRARASAMGASSPRMGHVAAASIRASAGQTSAKVIGGKGAIPWYGGHEFGSHRFPGRFPPFRTGGHHLYPALASGHQHIIEVYGEAIGDLVDRAFGS